MDWRAPNLGRQQGKGHRGGSRGCVVTGSAPSPAALLPTSLHTSTETLGAPWDHTQALTRVCYGEIRAKGRKERTGDLRLKEIVSECK